MLKFNFKDKTYKLPLLEGKSNHWIKLEEDEFDIELVFTVPSAMISNLYKKSNIIQTDENPIIVLNLEVNYNKYDFDTEEVKPIGNLKLNPTFADLENIKLSENIIRESTLYFPGYAQRAKIKSISFGKILDNEISIEVKGMSIDIDGELNFEITGVKIPLN